MLDLDFHFIRAAEALRRTKVRLAESDDPLSHPHYWAAFDLTGEGLQPVSRAMHWRSAMMLAGLALTVVLGGLLAIKIRRRGRCP